MKNEQTKNQFLKELLANYNLKIEDIKQIYSGKDHWCRCGCGGNYFRPEDKGFCGAITRLNNLAEKNGLTIGNGGIDVNQSSLNDKKDSVDWIDFHYNVKGNKAYTLYFMD